jgi:hypothetical protein
VTRGECGFCHGKPVGNAATWQDGKPRPPAPCPRCGRTNIGRPVDKASSLVAAKRQDAIDELFDDRVGRDD